MPLRRAVLHYLIFGDALFSVINLLIKHAIEFFEPHPDVIFWQALGLLHIGYVLFALYLVGLNRRQTASPQKSFYVLPLLGIYSAVCFCGFILMGSVSPVSYAIYSLNRPITNTITSLSQLAHDRYFPHD